MFTGVNVMELSEKQDTAPNSLWSRCLLTHNQLSAIAWTVYSLIVRRA
jgi:hypothetical protein